MSSSITTLGCCGQLVVGWRRRNATPFMKSVLSAAPPPLPAPSAPPARKVVRTAPCGIQLQRLGGFCSLCFGKLEAGARLSDDERLCEVCVCEAFDGADQLESSPPPAPPVALYARCDADGWLRREELEDERVDDRDRELLLSLRVGDELRCCGCIPRSSVRGRVGSFVGFCTRRNLGVLRIGDAVVCVRMALLRRPTDNSARQHGEMLRALVAHGASLSTLRRALAAVRSAHVLCGTPALAEAEATVDRLAAEQRSRQLDGSLDEDDEGVEDEGARLARADWLADLPRPCAAIAGYDIGGQRCRTGVQ